MGMLWVVLNNEILQGPKQRSDVFMSHAWTTADKYSGPWRVMIRMCKHILSLWDCAVRWLLECDFFVCFVDAGSPTALFCVTLKECGFLGSFLCMTLKDFQENGNDSLSTQKMERAVLNIFFNYFLQSEQEWNWSGHLNTWCGPNGERKQRGTGPVWLPSVGET